MQMAKLSHGGSMPVLTQTESAGGGGGAGAGGWLHPTADPFSNGGLLNRLAPAQPPSTIHHMEAHQGLASMQTNQASRQHTPGKELQPRYATHCTTDTSCQLRCTPPPPHTRIPAAPGITTLVCHLRRTFSLIPWGKTLHCTDRCVRCERKRSCTCTCLLCLRMKRGLLVNVLKD